ncbi:MAG: hypothetical protein COA96_16530 [SAR86 cluster bacterium]|uniref:Activator of Hsp90 ATPase homologue 1/2-like C-terminal domain-containing protein n=1 Tax=SAR86 cluster bacterium TaxID=2030880 RepID=A0A2A5AHQ8_9GAMM|nr:MAG: hypothetical protein COA96_16530 [SAR86 cluster bacterium]
MNNQNYTKTITVNAKPTIAYQAISEEFEKWWTKPDCSIRKVGDRAKFSFPPGKTYWVFEAIELIPDKRVELKCIEALHIFEGQPSKVEKEWLGSSIIFEITQVNDSTTIRFEHIGLEPSMFCYDICEAGWNYFFVESLKLYLDTGSGKPYQ